MAERRAKPVLGLFVISAIVVLGLSLYAGFCLSTLEGSLEQSRNDRLLAEAQAASLIVSAEELSSMQGVDALSSEQGVSLQRRLNAFAALHKLTEVSYVRQLPSGALQTIIFSDTDTQDASASTDPFASDALYETAFGGSIALRSLNESELNSSQFTAFSPVYDVQGTVIAVAAIGLDDQAILQANATSRTLTIVLLVSIAIVILAACANVLLQVRRENEREQALNHAVNASEAKSEFLSNMSHEMRTPMNAIIGMTAIALESEDAERKNYCLEHIGEASTHLLTMINDVLDLSSIQEQELSLKQLPFDLRLALDAVASDYLYRINEQNLDFSVSVDESIPTSLIGDRQRLSKVVNNLLSNAIKFTPKKGSVSLRVTHLSTEPEGHRLKFEVEDSGIGMDSAARESLFGSFEQIESGANRKYGGTGLGLALSRHLVELMGGTIKVESAVNKGSTFSFCITLKEDSPVDLRPEKAPRPADQGAVKHLLSRDTLTDARANTTPLHGAAPAGTEGDTLKSAPALSGSDLPETPDFSGYRILLAEDIEINREVVLALLEKSGITIDCVNNGVEALEALKRDPTGYQLVFMDLQMPEMDGLEATRRIRTLPEPSLSKLPIIAITANVFQEDIDICLSAGMNGHIGKPVELAEIYRVLTTYLS